MIALLRTAAAMTLCLAFVTTVATAGLPPATLQPVVYAVAVNGAQVSAGALLLQDAGHDIYARIDDLRSWRINVPSGLKPVVRAAEAYIDLRSVPGVAVSFDVATQSLLLRAGPTALLDTNIRLAPTRTIAVGRPAGAYANYALTQSGGSYGASIAGEVQSGIAGFGGIIKNDVAWVPAQYSRLQTAWEHDDPQRMAAIIVGDATTADARLGTAIRFAGVQWGSDFTEQPQFATFPGVAIRGAASVPSQLDIYVNDVLAEQRNVPAGPYTLRDLPVFDGSGTVAVRAADALGGTAGFSIPYYVSRNLLRPGLASFSYAAGFLDENGGYGPFIADASRRWGMSDALTGGAMAQFGGGKAIAGADADWLAGRAGVLSLAAAMSHDSRGAGMLWDAGYDYAGRRLTLGGEIRVASAGYASLDPTAIAIGHELNLHAMLHLTRAASAQISVARDATVAGPVTLWTASLAGNARGIPYSLTAYKTAGASAGAFGVTTALSIPVGRRGTFSPRLGSGGNSAQSQLEYSGSAGDSARVISWDVAAGMTRDATSTARLTAASLGGELDLNAISTAGAWSDMMSFTGAIAFLGGVVAPTREITGAYALVEVPGFANVDVYVNGRFAGRTNARGKLMTGELVPYVENEIRIDPSHLPASAHIDSVVRTVVPAALSGTTVTFAMHEETEARLVLRGRDGKPLRPGTYVGQTGGSRVWPIGLDGRVDLIGIAPGPLSLHVARAGEPECRFELIIPFGARITTLPDARC